MPKTAGPIKLWIRLTLPGVGQIRPDKIERLRNIREHKSYDAVVARADRANRALLDELSGLAIRARA